MTTAVFTWFPDAASAASASSASAPVISRIIRTARAASFEFATRMSTM
jgi:hypothetical protein